MSIVIKEDLSCLPGGFFTCRARAPYELVTVNPALLSLLHTPSIQQLAALTEGTLTGLVHREDRERVELLLKREDAFFDARAESISFRLHTTDAVVRHASCYLTRDTDDGTIFGFLADDTVRREEYLDLLHRKDLYHDLYRKSRLSEERFRFISSFAGVMLYEYDLSSRESSKFENSLDVLGYTEWEMQQIFVESKTTDCLRYLMTDEDYASISDFYERFHENGEAEGELRIRRKDGSYHWFYDKRCLVLSHDGDGSFIRGCLWNADATHRRISGLVESSERDGVTGLYNKTSGFTAIASHLEEKGTENTAFILFDVDDLKLINETLGHQQGDALLHLVGAELVRSFAQGGVVGRLGDDEFYAFLSAAGEKEVLRRKIKRLFAALREAKPLAELGVTLSLCVGIAFPDSTESVDALLSKARRALNDAKLLGGGQICIYQPVTPRSVDSADAMGLAQRKQFIQRAQKLVQDAPSEGSFLMLCVLVEAFDLFNEWFGSRSADRLVAEISYALSELEAENDALVSYFGESEFGVLIPNRKELLGMIEERLVGLSRSLSGTVAFLPSVGACPILDARASVGAALSYAREAAKAAFGNARERIVFYKAPGALSELSERELLIGVRDAIQKQEIRPYLCPVVSLDTEGIVGAQLISRWVRSDARVHEQEEYLAPLRKYALTTVLSRALWEKTFEQLHSFYEETGERPLPVAITVTSADMRAVDLLSTLNGFAEKYDLLSSGITLMLPESEYLLDEDLADVEIARLREGAYPVMLTDARLSYALLRRITEVRVDGVCIRAEELNGGGMREGEAIRILQRLITLAEERSIRVIVLDVGERALASRLASLGIREVAGDAYFPARTVSSYLSLTQKKQS